MSNHTFKFDMFKNIYTPHVDPESDTKLRGTIIARSQCGDGRCDQYLVRYHDKDGVEREDWFAEDRLT